MWLSVCVRVNAAPPKYTQIEPIRHFLTPPQHRRQRRELRFNGDLGRGKNGDLRQHTDKRHRGGEFGEDADVGLPLDVPAPGNLEIDTPLRGERGADSQAAANHLAAARLIVRTGRADDVRVDGAADIRLGAGGGAECQQEKEKRDNS